HGAAKAELHFAITHGAGLADIIIEDAHIAAGERATRDRHADLDSSRTQVIHRVVLDNQVHVGNRLAGRIVGKHNDSLLSCISNRIAGDGPFELRVVVYEHTYDAL